MDLRMLKTQNAIHEAFYALRKRQPLEKIRVNELCQTAQINKSTFYRHYLDVYDLSNALENEIIEAVKAEFSSADQLYSNPEQFVTGLRNALYPHREKILILFDGRMLCFADKMEEWLTTVYLNDASVTEEKITLSFVIGGAIHAFLSPKFESGDTARTIIHLLNNLRGNRCCKD